MFYCDKENEYITFISILLTTFFVTLIVLYWITYCFLGFKFKDDLTKTMKEEKELYYFDFSRNNKNRDNTNKIRERANSASITENYISQIPMMNSVIKNKISTQNPSRQHESLHSQRPPLHSYPFFVPFKRP